MITVLHVTQCVGGGVPAVIRALVRNVSEVRHVVMWPDENGNPPGADVLLPLPSGHLARMRALRGAIRNYHPDVVHAHSSWAGIYARLVDGHRTLYQPHAFAFQGYGPPILRQTFRHVERLLAQRTAAYALISAEEEELARALRMSVPRFRIPNAATPPPLAKHHAGPEPYHVVGLGRIATQKDPALFASVARAAMQLESRFSFLWIGDGDAQLREELERSGVKVAGVLQFEDAMRELGRAEILLHTARYEGFPLSVIEAATMGIPVVARDIAALDGYGLATFTNQDEAADLLVSIANDTAHRARAVDVGYQLAANMSPEAQASAALKAYRALG